MKVEQQIAQQMNLILKQIGIEWDEDQLEAVLSTPPNPEMGDVALPCFPFAKLLRKSPAEIATQLVEQIDKSLFDDVQAVGPYVNFFLNRQEVSAGIVEAVLHQGESYGEYNYGEGANVPIDMSSPNIAKPFSMGHLRSTVIGNALANILAKSGYRPVKINYLGDWGTQFGKLIAAYKSWGDETKVKENPIKELHTLYVRFHKEAENNPSLDNEGRAWFKKLEDRDQEAVSLWKWFRDESLEEFKKIYELLGVSFDSMEGESFYNDKMDAVVNELEEKGLLEESEGAKVVRLDQDNLPPCLIKKSDGATLYATRDLAAAIHRYNRYDFAKAFYVFGHEQSLHFKQFTDVLEKMGRHWAGSMEHVPFGMILKDGKKMSTRKGKVVLLEEVLGEAVGHAKDNIEERSPNLGNKEDIARQVGVGAVIFHDLKNDRMNNISFSLESMLAFEGETGPYVQYTHARSCSLLRKGGCDTSAPTNLTVCNGPYAWSVVTTLMQFPKVINRAMENADPSQIAKYTVDLAQAFNKFYGSVKILSGTPEEKQARLQLVAATAIVLKEGLRLLGIKAPEEM